MQTKGLGNSDKKIVTTFCVEVIRKIFLEEVVRLEEHTGFGLRKRREKHYGFAV